MPKKVLIVDDDLEMLLSLEDALDKYGDTFTVSIAGDGAIALEKLRKDAISLVVTDLKMPGMDGFALLARIMENYPEIPVIIMTGYSTSGMRKMALEGGAVGYIKKPFMVDDLGRHIMTILRRESDGGTLHSVSSGMFLQFVEMEEQTCTIRLSDRSTGRRGVLFFRDGELIDARTGNLKGEKAAYEMFSWDRVNLAIQNGCSQNRRTIHEKLQAVYLEAMRLKDEAAEREVSMHKASPPPVGEAGAAFLGAGVSGDGGVGLRERFERELGAHWNVREIAVDDTWENRFLATDRIGALFKAGRLKVGMLDVGAKSEFILLPGEKHSVAAINPKCPRDKILQILGS